MSHQDVTTIVETGILQEPICHPVNRACLNHIAPGLSCHRSEVTTAERSNSGVSGSAERAD